MNPDPTPTVEHAPDPDARWRRAAVLRAAGAGALLALYLAFLVMFAVLRAFSDDRSLVLIPVMAVAGVVVMLGVAVANLWARADPAAAPRARGLARACLALIAVTAVALAGIALYLSATDNSLAVLPAFGWIIAILIAALPTSFTLRALADRAPPGRVTRP